MNSRLDTLQAAVLKVKLKAFQEHELDAVNQIAERYSQKLRDKVMTPFIREGYYSSWAQYSILLKDGKYRENLQNFLKEKGIPTMIYYPKPMSRQTAFHGMDCVKTDLKITKNICERILSLPLYPYMEEEEQDAVIGWIREFE